MSRPDATVVGSGPNGLTAALMLVRAGLTVEIVEGADQPGGACRTHELTLPGFRHDVCSAVHPLAVASPALRELDISAHGTRFLHSRLPLAHPLDGGRAASLSRSVEETAQGLGADGPRYHRVFEPLVRDAETVVATVLRPMRSLPHKLVPTVRFGALGLLPARTLAGRFTTEEARALLAGVAAHSMMPLDAPLTGGYGLLLMMLAHGVGWPVVKGGSAGIVQALLDELQSSGTRVVTGCWVRSLDELPKGPGHLNLLGVTPRQLVAMAHETLPGSMRRALQRFRYGPGVCKVDWALSGAVPWQAPQCRDATTVHVGGTFEEVAAGEGEVAAGRHADRPFCIVVQPSIVDETRAPKGSQTLWAYCHVPRGSGADVADRIEAQIERFAPGFRELVRARVTTTAAEMESYNPTYVGGDINGGAATLRQTVFRPTARWNPYETGIDGVYLCSASTSPGGGVHGMCGYWAARAGLATRSRGVTSSG